MSADFMELAAGFPPVSDAEWRAMVEKAIKGRDFDKVMTKKSYNEIDIKGLYVKPQASVHDQPMPKKQGWGICTPHWNRDSLVTNKAIKEDLMGGATGVGLRFQAGHFPGLDPASMAAYLDGIYLDMVDVTLLPGEDFYPVATAYLAYARSKVEDEHLSGCLGCDPIGVLAQSGRLGATMDVCLAQGAEIASEMATKMPEMRTFHVNTAAYHTAGGSEKQELSIMLSTALIYLRAMEQAGMDLLAAASQIHFTLIADADIYLTMAKFRAARRLWAELLAHCGIKDCEMSLSAMGAVRMLSVRDPWVNMLRSTAACFAAVTAGAGEVTLLPHDAMIGMPSDFARRMARNIQIILQEESNVGQVIDPAKGSYAIESLTSELTQTSWDAFTQIEKSGGMVEGLKIGTIQAGLQDSWLARRQNLAKRKDAVTGVSEFPDIHEKPIDNTGPQQGFVTDVVEAAMEITPVAFHRLSEDFEALRDMSDRLLVEKGYRPKIFLANLGTVAEHTARATFAKNFFEAGGIETVPTKGFADGKSLITAFETSGCTAAVICGTDMAYEEKGLEIVAALRNAGAEQIYLAGRAADDQAYLQAGLTDFIYMGANVLECLTMAMVQFTKTNDTEEGDLS